MHAVSKSGLQALFVVLDACALVCGDGKDFRCEDKMAQNMEPGIAQTHLDWIDAALAPAAKWKIVMAHWPIYSFMGNGPSAVLERELVPRMVQAGVQVYFSGHDHSLQHVRLKPSALTGIKAKAAARREARARAKAQAQAESAAAEAQQAQPAAPPLDAAAAAPTMVRRLGMPHAVPGSQAWLGSVGGSVCR